ncbi:hypothetical protein [Georgenia thermotolerans]|uniref:Uncharacterized protein n=1 Tax=Georgenia thermotolerans TaxID=527326 RepID=A0A7J5UMF3_9MICO|nr:hypothetical protein [Georgenia thermotolerans]KAE8763537.1 hypothetical protein GB883_13560 [Georgenia thermotolerans]
MSAYESTFSPPDLRDDPRRLAREVLADRTERRRRAAESRAAEARSLTAELEHRLAQMLGGDGVGQLRRAMRQERVAFRDLLEPPGGLWLDRDAAAAARKARVGAVLARLGARPEAVRELGRETAPRWRAIVGMVPDRSTPGHTVRHDVDTWLGLSPFHAYPLPWGKLPDGVVFDPHGWELFRPPFFGFLFSFEHQASAHFRVDREHVLAPAVGLVGQVGTMDCDDADDWDLADIEVETQVAVGFVPPTTGVVEVLIDAQALVGTHDLEVKDEWGFSTHWTYQKNYLMADVLHPNVPESSLALMSEFHSDTEDDNTFHQENLVSGQHYYAQLYSTGPVPAGQQVVVTAGTRTFDITRADDMEVHSRTEFRWFVSSIEIRMAP